MTNNNDDMSVQEINLADAEVEMIIDGGVHKVATKQEKQKHLTYRAYLDEVQKYIALNYAAVLSEDNKKGMLKDYINQYKTDHHYIVDDINDSELVDLLYRDMAEYSVLTDYLRDGRTDIEEININSWDDITISYDNGSVIKAKEHFYTPQHSLDVIKRILQQSNMVLDMSKPVVRGFLGTNKRVTVIAKPVVDENVSVSASIRIVNPKQMTKEDFINKNTATEEILEFLVNCMLYKTSMCIAGETGTGKTTLMSFILSMISEFAPQKRIITIEEDVREFNLIKRDDKGRIINNIIHMVTRKSDNDKETISAEKLLEMALTMNPDIICVAEMKSHEAFAAQEAARTGHSVIGTTHANSARAVYDRLCTLCYQKYQIDYDILSKLVREAFPIAFFVKKMEDNARRITEIIECVQTQDGSYESRTIYQFVTESNDYDENGNCHVSGYYEKVNPISESLRKKLMENGMRKEMLDKLSSIEKED